MEEGRGPPSSEPFGMIRRLGLVLVLSLLLGGFGAAAPGSPPVLRDPSAARDLVELDHLDPSIHLDIRYATKDNFMRSTLYPQARAFLRKPAADALVRANRFLKAKGLGIVVFDGYRPWRITRLMWERASEAWRKGGYVADPANGSRHNRGCAVDLTLYDLKTGREVEMPTPYDDFTTRAHAHAKVASPLARTHRALLQQAMTAQGFVILPEEWWHFDYHDWKRFPLLDVDFADIPAPGSPADPSPSPLPR